MSRLSERRRSKWMTQQDLAEKSGVDVRQIQKFEAVSQTASRSINKAAAITVVKLAMALDCRVEDLMEEE